MIQEFKFPRSFLENWFYKRQYRYKNKPLINRLKFSNKGLSWYFTKETTRRRLVKDTLQESLLDQVLVTNDAFLNFVDILPELGKIYHVCVRTELAVSLKKPANTDIKHKQVWGKVMPSELVKFSIDEIDWGLVLVN